MRKRECLLFVSAVWDTDRRGGGVADHILNSTCRGERRLLAVTPCRNTFGLGAASPSRTAVGVVGISGGAAEVVGALAGTERHVRQSGIGGTV